MCPYGGGRAEAGDERRKIELRQQLLGDLLACVLRQEELKGDGGARAEQHRGRVLRHRVAVTQSLGAGRRVGGVRVSRPAPKKESDQPFRKKNNEWLRNVSSEIERKQAAPTKTAAAE